jgi:hypothetical protein
VERARQLVASPPDTPALSDADRQLLVRTLRDLRLAIGNSGGEHLLHGEPHPGNVLLTENGLLFIDFETSCRGPVEFDLAHAPDEVDELYPGADSELVRQCRLLVLAMITTWRWDRDDQLPNPGVSTALTQVGRGREDEGQVPRRDKESRMAQYAVLIYANDSAHAPAATADDTESCDQHADELVDAGSMLIAYALTPRHMATSIRADAVTDGPFVDGREIVAGFYVIEAPDLEAALAIAGTNPAIREGGGVEVRPVHSGGPVEPAPLSDQRLA